MPKVVSLLASATEIVCSLGCETDLVGRSHECDFPPSVHPLPICTSAHIDASRSSAEIDRDVKEHLRSGLPIYRVDRELLARLAPQVIVTQAHCEVCAVSRKDVEAVLGKELLCSTEIVTLMPNRLEDIWSDIARVAKAMQLPDLGHGLVEACRSRIKAISEKTKSLAVRPRVACLEWIEPLMAAGNWVPELVELAGGINLFGQAGVHSPWMEWTDLVEQDPDVIIVLPCGFNLARVQKEMPALTSLSGWGKLKAVQESKVFLVDGNQYFNRPGPRVVDSLEILAEILNPQLFSFGYATKAWIHL